MGHTWEGEVQGGRRYESTGADAYDTGVGTGQVMAPEETQAGVSAHRFCNMGTNTMFDICIINI